MRDGPGPLVEREWELECLRSAEQRALAGRGSVVVVEGTAGIGKTTLLTRTCEDAAARGFEVFRARGDELERELPYGVMRQFFERPLQRMRSPSARRRPASDPHGCGFASATRSA